MVHHSAVPLADNRQAPARLRQHQRYHQDQGWVDIAYHLGVDRSGNLYELRSTGLAGDTFTDYDPAGWLLVLAEGDFDRHDPTDAQLEGVAEALAWGAARFGVAPGTLAGHRDHAATSCPGDRLYRYVADGSLLARTEALLADGGVVLDRACGAAGRDRVRRIERG